MKIASWVSRPLLAVSLLFLISAPGHTNTVTGKADGTTVSINGTITAAVVSSVELRLDSSTGIVFTSVTNDGTSTASFTRAYGSVDAFGVSAPVAGSSVETAPTVDGSAFVGAVYWSPYSMRIRVSGGGTGTVTVLQTAASVPFGGGASNVRVVDCTTSAGCTTFSTIPTAAPELTLVSGVADNTTNNRSLGVAVPTAAAAGAGNATIRWTLTGM